MKPCAPALRRAWLPMLAALALALGAGPVRAAGPAPSSASTDDESVDVDRPLSEPPPHPTDVARTSAAALYNDGMASARKGRLKEALALFRAAYEQDGSPEALANMAVIEAALGRPRAAAEHLAKMLHNLPAAYASKGDDLRKRLAEQAALVGTWRVEVTSEGEVYADGKWIGSGPFTSTLYVEPGSHALRLQSRGVTVERSLTLQKGEVGVTTVGRDEVDVLVAKLPRPAPPAPPPTPSKVVLGAGISVSVGFAALGFAGIGVAVTAANEGSRIEDVVKRFGGTCVAPSPGLIDDCRARRQESSNENVGQILTGLGLGGAAVAGLGTVLYASMPELWSSADPSAVGSVQLVPAPGGLIVRGTF